MHSDTHVKDVRGVLRPPSWHLQRKPSRKHLWTVKLTLLLLTIITVTRAAETFSQKISLSVKDQPLEKVIEQIARQSGYAFLYDAALLKEARPVTLQAKNVTVESLLPQVFEQQPFRYE